MFDLGDHAIAEGALYAGCNFFCGYPITPATEIMTYMQRNLRGKGHFLQMEDEIASIGACIGAVWAGAKAMTATSGPGFSLMQENLGYAYMTETPLVLVNVQRTGPATGQATKPAQGDVLQAKYGTHGDYEAIVLTPWSVQEAYDLTIRAFNLAELLRTPVILLTDGVVGHMRENYERRKLKVIEREFPREKVNPFFDKMPKFGQGFELLVTGSSHRADGLRDYSPKYHQKIVKRICKKIINKKNEICEFESFHLKDSKKILISYGASARPSFGAFKLLRKKGEKVGFLRLKTLFPFPEIEKLCEGKKIYVCEMNVGRISLEVERVTKEEVKTLSFVGGVVPRISEILRGVLDEK